MTALRPAPCQVRRPRPGPRLAFRRCRSRCLVERPTDVGVIWEGGCLGMSGMS